MKNVQLLNFSAPVFDLDNRELIIEGKIRNTTEMRFMYEKINITDTLNEAEGQKWSLKVSCKKGVLRNFAKFTRKHLFIYL